MNLTQVHQSLIAPLTATGSTTARSLQDRFADVVNVKDFGAHSITEPGFENFDSTAAIQAAFNSGKFIFKICFISKSYFIFAPTFLNN